MPLGQKPSCSSCKTTDSAIWKKSDSSTSSGNGLSVLCSACVGLVESHGSSAKCASASDQTGNGASRAIKNKKEGGSIGPVRKSARIKPSKYRVPTTTKLLATKGKSRRVIFKKNPIKAPSAVASVVTRNYIFHQGQYWQVGDIVSVMDHGGGIYFAQVRGFLQDQYFNKSGVITWLLPTLQGPRDTFDPSTYILGPEEELPRDMNCFEFVCHAPSEYFKMRNSPYSTLPTRPELGFIWTSMGAEIVPLPSKDEIYGVRELEREGTSHTRAGAKEKPRAKSKEVKLKEESKEKTKDKKKNNKEKEKQLAV